MVVDFYFQTYNDDDVPTELEVQADVRFYPYSRDDPPDIEVDIQSLTENRNGETIDVLKTTPDFVLDKIEERAVEIAWEVL